MSQQPGIDSIFCAAVEIAAERDRAAYLDEACGDDTELRRRVEKLLTAHFQAGSFMHDDASNVTVDQPITEEPGTVIGPYKLLQQIGEGGMGVVYMAEQTEPVERRVALKIIKPGMDTCQVIARFEAERQALAMMDHPNIARVLDAGTTEPPLSPEGRGVGSEGGGRPYFVMELVKGLPITEYCDEHHLTPRERLDLFLPICQAVQHAHQKGVIHRDLKPSNILVARYDDRAVPKIIDFGVAKAVSQRLTEKTMFTQYGQIVGTIEYMSPEQAQFNQLDVDTRSDIYSLGVLLYELLTGETPFDKQRLRTAAFDELLRIIREEEPPPPSVKLSTSETLPSIAANRHVDPHKLSTLVRGELDWIVMKALEKDRTRRYETASAFAADVQHYLNDEAVVACPPSTTYRLGKFARRNRGRLASTGLALVAVVVIGGGIVWSAQERSAREGLLEQTVTAGLHEVNTLYDDQEYAEALAAVKQLDGMLAGAGDIRELADEVEQWSRDLEMLARLNSARLALAEITDEGEFDVAGVDRVYQEAFRTYGLDVDSADVDEAAQWIQSRRVSRELTAALDNWASVRRSLPEPDDAGWEYLVRVSMAADPDPFRARIRNLWIGGDDATRDEIRQFADSDEIRRIITSHDSATIDTETTLLLARVFESSGLRGHAESLLREAQRRHPDDFWLNFTIADRLAEGTAHAGEALGFYRAALAADPANSVVRVRAGWMLHKQEQYEAALAEYFMATERDPEYGPAHFRFGHTLVQLDELDGAIAAYRRAIDLEPEAAGIHVTLGYALAGMGEVEMAAAEYHTAVEKMPESPVIRDRVGNAFWQLGDFDEAVVHYRRATELRPDSAGYHFNLGIALRQLGKLDDAIVSYTAAIERDPGHALAHGALGVALAGQNKLNEAVACYERAIQHDPQHALAWYNLGAARHKQGKLDEALRAYTTAIDLKPDIADWYFWRGRIHEDLEQWEEAVADFSREVELEPTHEVLFRRGIGYGNLARWQEAGEDFRASIDSGATTPLVWWRLALVNLVLGDESAYRETCREMFDRISDAANQSRFRGLTAWTCALKPGGLADESQGLALAERAAGENRFGKRAYALWLYRTGDYQGAAAILEQWDSHSAHFLVWCQRAATYHRLGRHDEAQASFSAASDWRASERENAPWHHRVIFDVLYDEAGEVLKQEASQE